MTHADWEALLDRFESDLDSAHAPTTAWTPPASPLPPELAERAGAVLRRLQERVRQAALAGDDVRRQLDAVRRVPARGDAPAYLDAQA